MPIPQEKNFLWDGHLARPSYFCNRSIITAKKFQIPTLTRNSAF
ncbi:hypothetical protein QUB70_12740 [Microcoleus sp. A003_D6]